MFLPCTRLSYSGYGRDCRRRIGRRRCRLLNDLNLGEANVAARVGFSVALGEHVASGPAAVRSRLVEVGRISRTVLADVHGWRVVEAVDEPSAITTLAPSTAPTHRKSVRG